MRKRLCVLKCSVLFLIDILKDNPMNSHFTFNLAAFDVSFPSLLLATHLYFPLSFLFTFIKCINMTCQQITLCDQLARGLLFQRIFASQSDN